MTGHVRVEILATDKTSAAKLWFIFDHIYRNALHASKTT